MGSLRAILRHPDDLYPLLKLKYAARNAEKQIPPEPHWGFCYTMLHKVSRSFGLVIQQLDTDLRDAVSDLHTYSVFGSIIDVFEKELLISSCLYGDDRCRFSVVIEPANFSTSVSNN